MKKYTDGKNIIHATDKAYKVIYGPAGFVPYKKKNGAAKQADDASEAQNPISAEEIDKVDDAK